MKKVKENICIDFYSEEECKSGIRRVSYGDNKNYMVLTFITDDMVYFSARDIALACGYSITSATQVCKRNGYKYALIGDMYVIAEHEVCLLAYSSRKMSDLLLNKFFADMEISQEAINNVFLSNKMIEQIKEEKKAKEEEERLENRKFIPNEYSIPQNISNKFFLLRFDYQKDYNIRISRADSVKKAKDIEFKVNSIGCYVCTSHKLGTGGRGIMLGINNETIVLHRAVYEGCVGKIEENKDISKICNNPYCCNPKHMELIDKEERKLGRKKGNKKREIKVKQTVSIVVLDLDYNLVASYDKGAGALEDGYATANVLYNVCKGKAKKHNDYIFLYLEDYNYLCKSVLDKSKWRDYLKNKYK